MEHVSANAQWKQSVYKNFDRRYFICQEKTEQDRSARDLWQEKRDAEGNAEEQVQVRRDIVFAPSAVRK
jgi:hypothetical protein